MKTFSISPRISISALAFVLMSPGAYAFQAPQSAAQTTATPAAPGRGQPNPQQLANQQAARQDHQQMMDQLHITSLRPGANARVAGSANYDEAKANPYPDLPDPLTLKNGKKVSSAKMWWDQRRPEIVEDVDREVYGRVPKSAPKVKWEVTGTANEHVGEIPIVTKTLVGHVDNSAYPDITVDIQFLAQHTGKRQRSRAGNHGFRRRPACCRRWPARSCCRSTGRGTRSELAGAGACQRMGLRGAESEQHSGG